MGASFWRWYYGCTKSARVRKQAVLLSTLLAGVLLCGCGGSFSPAAGLPASTPSPSPSLVMAPKPQQTFFLHFLDEGRIEPAALQGRPGELVKLILVGDHRKHDLTSPSLNINQDVLPGQVAVIEVRLPSGPGEYAFWSAQPGDRQAGMEGHFTVR